MEITKEQLAELYNSMPNKQLCERLGITNATLVKYLVSADIPLKGKGNRNKKTKILIQK